jgi:hypothetical protein
MKCRWNQTMLNLCGIVVTILKMATGRNNGNQFGTSLSTHISNFYYIEQLWVIAVFWRPFWKWKTSRKFWKRKIAPLMVTYHYVKCYHYPFRSYQH